MNEVRSQNIYIEKAGRIIEITGSIVFLARYYLDGKLAYQSSQLILNNNYFAAFIIVLTLTPNVYLGITNASSTLGNGCLQGMRFLHACRNGTWKDYFNKRNITTAIGYTFATALAGFGIGSTITVVEDTVDFKGDEALKAIIISFTALLATNATTTLYDIVSSYISRKFAEGEERLVLEIEDRVSSVIGQIERMSAEEFESLISDINQCLQGGTLLDDLASLDQYEALRERILNSGVISDFHSHLLSSDESENALLLDSLDT